MAIDFTWAAWQVFDPPQLQLISAQNALLCQDCQCGVYEFRSCPARSDLVQRDKPAAAAVTKCYNWSPSGKPTQPRFPLLRASMLRRSRGSEYREGWYLRIHQPSTSVAARESLEA
ncbi:unnamed protein product [Schistocephalus solidus]|uniref:Zf-RVT domain-containing protein n=1 Tax=Schistocephalus solidus TaxID=70667 RepID=A0A183TSU0_SCHSO|nr:unnamed protein product [Schistocephalus solidus]